MLRDQLPFHPRLRHVKREPEELCRVKVDVLDISSVPDHALQGVSRIPPESQTQIKRKGSRLSPAVGIPAKEMLVSRWGRKRLKMLGHQRAATCCEQLYQYLLSHGAVPTGTYVEIWQKPADKRPYRWDRP